MLMGFPYGREFVYDEMVLTGPGEQGEANARRVMAANTEKTAPARRTGRGAVEGRTRDRRLRSPLCCDRARRPPGPRAVKGDRDPGYGSTSKMIAECAICLLRDTPELPGGIWTSGAAMGNSLIRRLVDRAGLTFTVEK